MSQKPAGKAKTGLQETPIWATILSVLLLLGVGALMTVIHQLTFMVPPCADPGRICDWGLHRVSNQLLLWGPAVLSIFVIVFSVRAARREVKSRWVLALSWFAFLLLYAGAYALSSIALGWRSPIG